MTRLTPEQLQAVAQAYCMNRMEQDGNPRHWQEHVEVANLLSAWYYAFESVLRPSREMVEGDL